MYEAVNKHQDNFVVASLCFTPSRSNGSGRPAWFRLPWIAPARLSSPPLRHRTLQRVHKIKTLKSDTKLSLHRTAPRRPSERRRRQMTRHTMCPTQALHNYNCRLSNNLISFLLPSLISSSYRSAFCIPAKRLDASPCSCLSFKKTVSCTFLFSLAASGPTNFFPFNAIAKLSEYSSFFSLVCALAYFIASATTSGNN